MDYAVVWDHCNDILMRPGRLLSQQEIRASLRSGLAYRGPTNMFDLDAEELVGHFLNGLARGLGETMGLEQRMLSLDTIILSRAQKNEGRFSSWFMNTDNPDERVYIHRANQFDVARRSGQVWWCLYLAEFIHEASLDSESRTQTVNSSEGRKSARKDLSELLETYRLTNQVEPIMGRLRSFGHPFVLCRSECLQGDDHLVSVAYRLEE